MPTLPRRNTDPGSGGRAPLRSSLAHAAWAVEDRVVWGAADFYRAAVEVVRWPFERIAWAVEHWLIWPIEEETALWSKPVRGAVLAGVILLAAAGVAAGIAVSDPSSGSGGSSGTPTVLHTSAPALSPTPVTPATPPKEATEATGPVLHGAAPNLGNEHGGGVSKAEAATEPPAAHVNAGSGEATAAGAEGEAKAPGVQTGSGAEVAGPAAIRVAREFSGAFVLYETGRTSPQVKSTFHRTATPDLAKALLKRPPRLPANVKVPKAKVLNIVAGPKHGDTYELSVSLLRVGVTSELRIDMQRVPASAQAPSTTSDGQGSSSGQKGSKWLVTDVLG
jgi:hypothetical protein